MRSRLGGAGAATAAAELAPGTFSPMKKESPTAAEMAPEDRWEVRPGGMLVQKRNPGVDLPAGPVPAIRVKVKHGAVYHEIYISSQATFGELKKALSGRTGLHPQDQKLIYKDKERDNVAFLDTAGVKDKSKLVVVEDPVAKAKRLLEERKAEKMEKAAKSIAAVSLEVDKLKSKVTALEAIVNKGGRVVEDDVTNLIELLMNQLLKLDAIVADGDVKMQRTMQVKRVQKYVEILDVIKVKNAMPRENVKQQTKQSPPLPPQPQPQPQPQKKQMQQPQPRYSQENYLHYQQHQPAQPSFKQQKPEPIFQQQKKQLEQTPLPAAAASPPAATATKMSTWDIFDSLFSPSTSTPTSAATTATSTASSTPTTRFDWELF